MHGKVNSRRNGKWIMSKKAGEEADCGTQALLPFVPFLYSSVLHLEHLESATRACWLLLASAQHDQFSCAHK